MTESVLVGAFAWGLVSACSLPLGAATAALWEPGDRVVAVLMAFGGGALLAALTIDLVGSSLATGQFPALALGCVIGGLLFRGLNELVNNRGGFLRKSSTVIFYLRRKRRQRFRRILSHLDSVDVLRDLPPEDDEALARAAFSLEFEKGASIFRKHDPSERLYVLDQGSVALHDPDAGPDSVRELGPGSAFGYMGAIVGTPRAVFAVAGEGARVWVVPKAAFEALLLDSAALAGAVRRFVAAEEVGAYLREHHGLSEGEVEGWRERALACVEAGEPIPDAVPVRRRADEFLEVCDRIGRFALFRDLDEAALAAIASRLIHKAHRQGDTIYRQREPAERLYVVDRGQVALVDPDETMHTATRVGDHDVFGGYSFLTGARHSVTAVATEDTTMWVLRKRDFDELLPLFPELDARIKRVLEESDVPRYLSERQHFGAHAVARWNERAVRSLDAGRLMPSAADMAEAGRVHAGAPVAIWLGILLDGVPESLVIGASLVHVHVSYSLIAGLFLSNYPEALSSSVGMRQQGFPVARILTLWTSLMVITGVGAALGSLFFTGAQPFAFALVQGIAAGAMLTMIAETMVPEAYFKGGSVVGLSTLFGFLTAIFFRTLE